MKYILALLFLLVLSPALADHEKGHIILLTVADDLETSGGVADLYLEVRSGSGAIFIDSFPLTRLDTQGSTRYANQIACDFLQVDCSQYDFFYTIRAGSTIVGGPSAGAAISVVTVAVLDDLKIAQDTAMTGTINSGGIIGPVGGVLQKVKGAKQAGVARVIIPSLANTNETNETNSTPVMTNGLPARGLVEELSDDEIAVIRVGTLEEALELFTGKQYRHDLPDVVEPEEYTRRMLAVADDICGRTTMLRGLVADHELIYNDTQNYTARITAVAQGREYSRASLCFSINIELNRLVTTNRTVEERQEMFVRLVSDAEVLRTETEERDISTITDLEVYAIVMERVVEAEQLLVDMNLSDPEAGSLAYAEERMTSAQSWSRFFGIPGKTVVLDDEYLRNACLSKLAEAEERISYVGLYSDLLVGTAQETLAEAYKQAKKENVLCIFTASKAKAQANIVAGVLFLSEQNLAGLIQEKLRAGELILQKQTQKGFFPLLGYSYTKYAADLVEAQPYSALTFAEYSLELSNLDMYFPQERKKQYSKRTIDGVALFLFGTLFGASLAMLMMRRRLLSTVKKKRKK